VLQEVEMSLIIGLIRLFIRNSQVQLQRQMEYRVNYISGIVISMVNAIFPAVFQYLIFTQTKGFPGWSLEQIIMFQGMLLVVVGIRNTLFGEVHSLVTELVQKGDFDRLLLKPYPPIGTIMASGFSANNLGTILTGGTLVVYTAIKIGISVGPFELAMLAVSLICGLVFFASINIIYCSITLMIIFMGGIWDLFQNILNISQYPKEIFPKVVQTVFVTAVPFMVMVYFPTQILLARVDITIIYAIITSFVFLVGSIAFWNRCLKKYNSAGG
jgi:ABC-2 type transport system permease protein